MDQFKDDIAEFAKANKYNSNISQFKNNVNEFVKSDKALLQEQTNTTIIQSHQHITSHQVSEDFSSCAISN